MVLQLKNQSKFGDERKIVSLQWPFNKKYLGKLKRDMFVGFCFGFSQIADETEFELFPALKASEKANSPRGNAFEVIIRYKNSEFIRFEWARQKKCLHKATNVHDATVFSLKKRFAFI